MSLLIPRGVTMINDLPEPHNDSSLKESGDRQTRLKEMIAAATAEIEQGEFIELNGEDELHAFFEGIKREGRSRLLQSRNGDSD